MVGPEPISGEPSIIIQLNRQDSQQRIQRQADEAPANSENLKSPTQAERLYGEKDIVPAAAAAAVDEGADREPENIDADRGNVTESRGQNVNLLV